MLYEELLEKIDDQFLGKDKQDTISVCVAAGCLALGSDKVLEELKRIFPDRNVKGVGCLGLCSRGTLVRIEPEGFVIEHARPDNIDEIVNFIQNPQKIRDENEKFYTKQQKIVLKNCGKIDPESIEEYILNEGYKAFLKCLNELSPDEVINEVIKSGLRGRGGGGYPTGLKWSTVGKMQSPIKYVVCNADEGDPGAFMDRAILESDPHKVIEGMLIAAYAVGANRGYVYVRAEYPLAIKRLKTAIKNAERFNLLGTNIGGTTFNFNLEVRLGAGAYVCGEETALIASIEGKKGTPRPRPPYPAESGIKNYPTLINNVETYANISTIINNGSEWFASIGTDKSKGTKVFALSGNIKNTGLVEVPMGIKLYDLIFEIGGGIPNDKEFKAVQTGGPSGGCIPSEYLNTSVDYESLTHLGSIMGSGGMIVMDEDTCMVDMAKFFIDFCKSESCGKCAPCRNGTVQLYEILDKITKGEGNERDLITMIKIANTMKKTSLCGLGQSAPNPVLSAFKYFKDEFYEHVLHRYCPAGVCKFNGGNR